MVFEIKIGPLTLQNPLVIAPGTASRDGETCSNAAKQGFGAVITKTVQEIASPVPRPCIAKYPGGLLNCEGWSDLSPEEWWTREIKIAKKEKVPLIVNIYGEYDDANRIRDIIIHLEEAGIDAFEVAIGEYAPDPEDKKFQWIMNFSSIPVIAKVPHSFTSQYMKAADAAVDAGVIALSTMDSLGPGLLLDIHTGRPFFGSEQGNCRISGSAIRPLAVRKTADLAQKFSIPIIGMGGVTSTKDVIEMLLAGASAVGVATAPILNPRFSATSILNHIQKYLKEHDYNHVLDIIGLSHDFLNQSAKYKIQVPLLQKKKCTSCKLCARSCPYNAITMIEKIPSIDKEKCYGCGLCVSLCRVEALRFPLPND
jgi:dihydroorotate dehydrogenase subfamily 1